MGVSSRQDAIKKADLFSEFFRLGHKFVPRSVYSKLVPLDIIGELRETQRKIVWQDMLGVTEKKQSVIYVDYRKNTPANADLMRRMNRLIDPIIAEQCNALKYNIPFSEKQYSLKYWRNTLSDLVVGGRFMCCDKNLGVRFVEMSTYIELAKKEKLNYEILPDISQSVEVVERIEIDKMIFNLRRITETINDLVSTQKKQPRVQRTTECLAQIASYITFTVANDPSRYKLPRLRMTLKIHKIIPFGALIPTRPIVPNCGLPNFGIAKWLGCFMAKLARQIPWNLESTNQFQEWLSDRCRGPRVRTYDFSNLYGNEPILQTIELFNVALDIMKWTFDDPTLKTTFDALMVYVNVPENIGAVGVIGKRAKLIIVLLYECVRMTIAQLDMGAEIILVATAKFLAMGCPPVAPLSIISLAFLEYNTHGPARCTSGMRRLIDDIVVDHDIISETQLRSAYPSYLTLNESDRNHFLDLSFSWNGICFKTWPYIKPHATIPLSFFSQHPPHTLRSAAKNELKRMIDRTSLVDARAGWVYYWYARYQHAQYPDALLHKIFMEVLNDVKIVRLDRERGINHIELWRGFRTQSDKRVTKATGRVTSTAWGVDNSLLSIALKAHLK